MSNHRPLSKQTQQNWLIAAVNVVGGLVVGATSVYFLFIPSGGYQGGRNPMYGVTIFFGRETWDLLHTWSGVAAIVVLVVHFVLHWDWVVLMAKRVVSVLFDRDTRLSGGSAFNIIIDLIAALSFLLTALSGITFLFMPAGGYQGGANPNWDPGFLFSRTTWDLIHTWAGVALMIAVVVHFAIHWRWVVNVTRRMVGIRQPSPASTLVSQNTQSLT
jgi:hypothetical protein